MEKTGKVVKGVWDCDQCNATKISRDYMNCPNCGAPQGENVKFYIDDYNNYATDAEADHSLMKGPHWLCSYCGSWTEGDKGVCRNCGATREASDKNYFDIQEKKRQRAREKQQEARRNNNQPSNYHNNRLNNTNEEVGERANTNDRSTMGSKGSKLTGLLTIFIFVMALAGLAFIVMPKEKELNITGFSWERSIQVEKYQTIKDSGWSAPSGARVTDTRKEQSGTKQIEDGTQTITEKVAKQVQDGYTEIKSYKDLGNGDFKEYVDKVPKYKTVYETVTKTVPKYKTVPVYDTKYYYDLDVWRKEKKLDTKGNDKNPYWDDTDITENNAGTSNNPKVNDLREAGRTEEYYVNTADKKGRENVYKVDKADWDKLELGQKVKAKIYRNGHLKLE